TTKANGGGTTSAYEGFYYQGTTPLTGYFGGSAYFGRDLNGDGTLGVDTNRNGRIDAAESDRVTVVNPSQTNTRRYVAIANLSYELDDNNRVRLSYSFDRARHRQTGEAGFLDYNGEPLEVFPVNDGLTDAAGNILQKRD
ncbi:hypothetical protein LTR94_033736, partial [Friedmanniomyces endolithicus]